MPLFLEAAPQSCVEPGHLLSIFGLLHWHHSRRIAQLDVTVTIDGAGHVAVHKIVKAGHATVLARRHRPELDIP